MTEFRLTVEEQAMLEGAEGPGVQRAMEIVATLGRIYGAPDLAPVTHAQIAGVSYKNLGDAGVQFLKDWAAEGAQVRVPTTLNPAGMELARWQEMGISPSFAEPQLSAIDAFTTIVHKDHAFSKGQAVISKLKDLIPRQLFVVPIQAVSQGRVISRANVKAMRKDVLAKCYGGDVTRKRKLLEKQKKGKKRMKMVGSVEIPQEAFLAVLRLNDD